MTDDEALRAALDLKREMEVAGEFFDTFDADVRAALHQVVLKHYPHLGDMPSDSIREYARLLKFIADLFVPDVDKLAGATRQVMLNPRP